MRPLCATALGGPMLAGGFAFGFLIGGVATGVWLCATAGVIIVIGVTYISVRYLRLPP